MRPITPTNLNCPPNSNETLCEPVQQITYCERVNVAEAPKFGENPAGFIANCKKNQNLCAKHQKYTSLFYCSIILGQFWNTTYLHISSLSSLAKGIFLNCKYTMDFGHWTTFACQISLKRTALLMPSVLLNSPINFQC